MPLIFRRKTLYQILFAASFTFLALLTTLARAQTVLLNVSYDPTRELYRDISLRARAKPPVVGATLGRPAPAHLDSREH